MRDRLKELCYEAKCKYMENKMSNKKTGSETDFIVDNLIENGVILPPCEIVYFIVDKGTKWAFVSSKHTDFLTVYELKDLKKYGYYLTKEEAEKVLRGEGE